MTDTMASQNLDWNWDLNNLGTLNCRRIDTASLHPFTNPHLAEEFLGGLEHDGLLIDIKAMRFDSGNNTLTLSAVQKPANESMERLKTHKANIFHCHGPDYIIPSKSKPPPSMRYTVKEKEIRKMATFCGAYGIDMAEASMRWVLNHSVLSGTLGDAVIVGPRNQAQLGTYAAGIHIGPLPEKLVEDLNGLFEGLEGDAAPTLVYWYAFSILIQPIFL
ncbi:putative NADP-dependent oxidoreductase domain-containing protein [Seiridium unicorne]|uniref:NADP-dependent oxidoreductase domain-containing protein n=1 Tax=Seiridium unicorne TaxID=138068 RepID=A0ABR2UMN5_9PEZI